MKEKAILNMSQWVDIVAKSREDSWVPTNPSDYVRCEGIAIVAYCSVLNKSTGYTSRTLQYRITTDECNWYSDKDYEDIIHLHGFNGAQSLQRYHRLEDTDVDIAVYVGHYYDAVLWIPQKEYDGIKQKLLHVNEL